MGTHKNSCEPHEYTQKYIGNKHKAVAALP
ncbi:hypothetical protein SAMN05443429_1094 [Cruoricaptor ignavus]|uniref:Uncharacterized protein n=1 Tax=Cruoricaptor ignavus TaxID=1118202 RepID=A0A1M6GGD8_9FLAO|nr:hypothetical protein SAMN05443429_1094 [Cruoricaptor ignavus]